MWKMGRMVMQKTWLFLAIGLFAVCPATTDGAGGSEWLVSTNLLGPAKLAPVWQTTLPVRPGERLEMVRVLEDRLYVRSAENYVWSLDRRTGDIVFSHSIAPAGFPIFGWTAYDDRLITVIDNQVVELDANAGTRKRVSDLNLSIIAPPVRNSEFFYVSAADRRLHLFRAEDMVKMRMASADNDSQITSVLAGEDMVVFGTDAGNLVAMATDAPRKLWQFDVPGAIAGPVVRSGDSFFFASKDTCVYRVDATEAGGSSLAWRYQAEAILDREPRVTAAVVYQSAPGRGVTAIGRRSGRALWTLAEGVDLLAEAGNRAYVFTKFNTLVVMDNASGNQVFWVNCADVSYYATNTNDARIYLADQGGRVLCIEPIR
jgi:outer membrane protein assembly factor BamB